MAEFICIHETDASLLPCVLRKLKGSLSLGPPESAAGVGYFQSDDVLVRKRPLASQPPQFLERIAEGVESEAVLMATGSLSRSFKEETTLPIRFKRWLFALAGQPEALAPAREPLAAALPQSLRRAARSESAAEAIFFTFLSRLRDAGRLDDADVDAQTAARSLAAAVGEAERAFEQAGLRLPPLAAIATNGRVLGALRRGHPVWLATVEGLSECALHEVGPGSKELDPKVRAHKALRALVLASGAQPQAPKGARELAEGEVLAVPRTLEPQKV
ncbi:MAG TPA: class II glutamine amidotransferase [Myxococcales bacterium]|nr:class II glutamine amidotransferase [Myxococcales bacterium]